MKADKITITERFLWLFNTIFHQTYAVVTIYILWIILYNYKLDAQFTWHMFASTLAYLPLMGEAIVLFAGDNVWSKNMDRTTKYKIHGVILVISAILLTLGISVMVNEKTGNHFKSNHAWTGLVSWIFVLLSQFLGIAAANPQPLSRFIRPVYVKFLHNFLGLLGYIFGVVSLAYGLEIGSFARKTSKEAQMAAFCLLAITTLWSILAALKSAYLQLRTILF